jgi:hypothetical protein
MPSGFFDNGSSNINGQRITNKNARLGALKAAGASPFPAAVTTAAATNRAGLEARLQAINPTYYTDTRLRQMTNNDLIYALRVQDDAANIK